MKAYVTRINKNKFFLIFSLILIVFAYFPQFTADFIGDDTGRIQEKIDQFSLTKIHENQLGDRPVLLVSLWFDINILGLNAGSMRAENLIYVGLICLLMFKIIEFISTKYEITLNREVAMLTLLAFFLHPINSQAIGHVIQRGILLSTLFGLAATYILLTEKKYLGIKPLLLALLFWILALLSKPNIAFLPLAWLLIFSYLKYKKPFIKTLPFLVMLVIPVFLYKIGQYNQQNHEIPTTAWEYFLTQGEAIGIYLKLFLIPYGLKFNHDLVPTYPMPLWPALGYWLSYLFLITMSWRFLKPKISFIFILCFALALTPESSFFPIIHFIFEHRTFTPLVFLTIALIFYLSKLKFKFLPVFMASLCVLYSLLTFQRNNEVKKYEQWAMQEIGQSCNVNYIQHVLTGRMIFLNKLKELDLAIKKLENNCSEPSWSVFVNRALYNLANDPVITKENLNVIKYYLHSDNNINFEVRELTLKVFSNILLNKGMRDEMSCIVEDILSHQLRLLMLNQQRGNTIIRLYVANSNLCLDQLDNGINMSVDNFQRLKIRTIQNYYFNRKDPLLAEDLRKAPIDDQHNYLRKLLSDKNEYLKNLNQKE